MSPTVTFDERIRELLVDELATQRAVLHSYTAALRDAHEDDVDDRLYTAASHQRVTDAIHEIELALARLDAGTYGVCESCGRRLAATRLEALPTARLCLDCALATVRGHRNARPHRP